MSDRRTFLKTALFAAAGASAVSLRSAQAADEAPQLPGILHSAAHPGQWTEKAGSHAPVVEVAGDQATVTTPHDMALGHYIVKHTIVTEGGEVIGNRTFQPTEERAVSTYTIPAAHKGKKLLATSFCNLHDMWITAFHA